MSSILLGEDVLAQARQAINNSLETHNIAILPPLDVEQTLQLLTILDLKVDVTMLDPWYNKGVGGVRDDYKVYILRLLEEAGRLSQHLFLWGFPEIVATFIESLPSNLKLVAWLTWYYKNSPSVIRGWRSSQMTCLHLSQPQALLYPEHFLNEAQKQKWVQGKLRYIPGPTSVLEELIEVEPPQVAGSTDVIEEALLVGFVGRKEQTGHPAQKPVGVFQRLYLMTTLENDLILDPMCGSGTTGKAAQQLGRQAILGDISEEYIQICEKRLGVERVKLPPAILNLETNIQSQKNLI